MNLRRKILTRSWWAYVWQAPTHYTARSSWKGWDGTLGRWTVRWCRFRGHPGPIFYNAGGLEPDNRCERCWEQIA